jgi:glycerophosphoryl diester phosphodiesterase
MVTHPVRRALASAVVTLALVAVLLLVPDAVRVYATNMMGALRAPGEPAFISGHRGDRAHAPENTMAAFEAAFASGLEFVETDVQLTADGVPVLMHDETVDRTTDGTGAVADLTLAEIRALDAGSWYAPEYAGTQVPLLDEFLDALTGTRKKALVELKGYWAPEGIRTVLDAVYLRGVQNRIVFASFNLTTIAHLADTAPAIPRIAILTTATSLENDPHAVRRMHEAGLGVLVYTLNSEKRWSEALAYGIDGIITDKPSKLDGWIAKTAPGT